MSFRSTVQSAVAHCRIPQAAPPTALKKPPLKATTHPTSTLTTYLPKATTRDAKRATHDTQIANFELPIHTFSLITAVYRRYPTKMDIENHTKVYLPDNVVIDASRDDGKAYRNDIKMRMAGNKYFAQVLRQGGVQKDQRILRVARLLDQLNGQEQRLVELTDELFDICDKEKLRYVGYHPRLEKLIKDVRCAADFVDEFAKRVVLWLEHLRTTGSTLSDSARTTLGDSVSKQRDMTLGLVWSAAMANPAGKIRPPGPGRLPYGVRPPFSLAHID